MLFNIVVILIQLKTVLSDGNIDNSIDIYERDKSYHGEKFPEQYLTVDGVKPTQEDLSYYVDTIGRIFDFFSEIPNNTDHNVALGSYLAKAVIKRTILDYGDKIETQLKNTLKDIVRKAEDIVSHHVYESKSYGHEDLGYQLSTVIKNDESLIHSIGKIHKNSIQKWIKSNVTLNKYIEKMDDISFSREDYIRLCVNMDDYYLIDDSDACLGSISMVPQPLRKNMEFVRCDRGPVCRDQLLKKHTVAYALSHRFLYLELLKLTRRCYVFSEEVDRMHMDIMCANMYRETVYLARRGHFFRDLFLEHISLCGLLGYEEFFRWNWFVKTARWIDEDGCMVENRNFHMIQTHIKAENVSSSRERKRLKRKRDTLFNDECHFHQMTLASNVLAQGIRHALHYL